MRSLVKELYDDPELKEKMSMYEIIDLIFALNEKFSLLNLNAEVLKVYQSADSLQTKHFLELPFNDIFPS